MSTNPDLLRRVRDRLATLAGHRGAVDGIDPRDAALLAELDAALKTPIEWRAHAIGVYRASVGSLRLSIEEHAGGECVWKVASIHDRWHDAPNLAAAQIAAEQAAGAHR